MYSNSLLYKIARILCLVHYDHLFLSHYLGIEQNIQTYFCKIFKGNFEELSFRGLLCKLALGNQQIIGILTPYSEILNNKADLVNLHYQIGANIKDCLGQPLKVVHDYNKTFCFILINGEFTPNTPDPLLIIKLSLENYDYPLLYFFKTDSENYEIQEIKHKEIFDQKSGNLKCYLIIKDEFNKIEPFIFNQNEKIVGILLPDKLEQHSDEFLNEEYYKKFNKFQCVLIGNIKESLIGSMFESEDLNALTSRVDNIKLLKE